MLIDMAVRTALILFVAWLVTMAMRRSAAATRHLVWTLAVVGALLLPVCAAVLPPVGSVKALSQTKAVDSGLLALLALGAGPSAVSPQGREPSAPSPVSQRFSAANALFGIWAVGALVLLARIGIGISAVRRLAGDGRPADSRWRMLLQSTIEAVGVRCPVALVVSRDIGMPMTWGYRPAVLLLPLEALEWSDERARVVLLHELAHVHRVDSVTHALGRVLVALHWFNPLAWIALGAMTRERERACDDFVLAHGTRPSEYAQHLLDIARDGISAATYGMAPAMARTSEFEGRLLSILTERRRKPARFTSQVLAATAVLFTLAVGAAAPHDAAPQQRAATTTRTPRRAALTALNEPSPEERQAPRQERESRKALARTAVGNRSPGAREEATLALALSSQPDVVDVLLRALKDESSQVREKAALGLALRRDSRVVDALLEAAADPDSQVREKVMIALSLSGDGRAIAALTTAAADPDPQVREKAVSGLALSPMGDAIREGLAGALRRRP